MPSWGRCSARLQARWLLLHLPACQCKEDVCFGGGAAAVHFSASHLFNSSWPYMRLRSLKSGGYAQHCVESSGLSLQTALVRAGGGAAAQGAGCQIWRGARHHHRQGCARLQRRACSGKHCTRAISHVLVQTWTVLRSSWKKNLLEKNLSAQQ